MTRPLAAATVAVHADDRVNILTDVAPALHTSTTFRYPRDPSALQPSPASGVDPQTAPLCYSRVSSSNINRLETILTPLLYPSTPEADLQDLATHVVSYSSGLSAFHAILTNVVPKVIAISDGYHGCHGVISLHTKMHGLKTVDVHADDAAWDAAGLGKGDIVHIETPINPQGECFDLRKYAARARARGALLTVDATFGPPGLQDPFAWGADVVMHSGTKYIGGHSDMLCGVLAVKKGEEGRAMAKQLRIERIFLGAVLGNMESWLGVRSLRTLELRVQRQSTNATKLVSWLSDALENPTGANAVVAKVVAKITHASLQAKQHPWVTEQMPGGYGPVFSFYTKTPVQARELPSHLQLFHHATSLGGVESLIEWRRMSDSGVDERLLRVSIGVESWEDLRDDLVGAFEKLVDGAEVQGEGAVDPQTGEKGARVEGAADGAI